MIRSEKERERDRERENLVLYIRTSSRLLAIFFVFLFLIINSEFICQFCFSFLIDENSVCVESIGNRVQSAFIFPLRVCRCVDVGNQAGAGCSDSSIFIRNFFFLFEKIFV